jgi:putative phosphoesterase
MPRSARHATTFGSRKESIVLIGVVSDIHDHLPRLRAALQRLDAAGAEALICCGDLCSPFVISELARGFPARPIHVVFGNNDGDRYRITTFAQHRRDVARTADVEVHGESAALELGGKRIFVHHFNDVGALIAAAGEFDVVCYGHNHEWKAARRPGASLEINPGAIMGWHPRRGDIPSTYALYDTESDQANIFNTDNGEEVSAGG